MNRSQGNGFHYVNEVDKFISIMPFNRKIRLLTKLYSVSQGLLSDFDFTFLEWDVFGLKHI